MTGILGPCRCQGCGKRVWWAAGHTRYKGKVVVARRWRDWRGRQHVCGTNGDAVVQQQPTRAELYRWERLAS